LFHLEPAEEKLWEAWGLTSKEAVGKLLIKLYEENPKTSKEKAYGK